jgi:hypothetical protein
VEKQSAFLLHFDDRFHRHFLIFLPFDAKRLLADKEGQRVASCPTIKGRLGLLSCIYLQRQAYRR